MTKTEKAQWLSDFYQQVADGGEMDFSGTGSQYRDNEGPNMTDQPDRWRVKARSIERTTKW